MKQTNEKTIKTKSVEELLPIMGESYGDLSVQVAYKEGYNKAISQVQKKVEEAVREFAKTLYRENKEVKMTGNYPEQVINEEVEQYLSQTKGGKE